MLQTTPIPATSHLAPPPRKNLIAPTNCPTTQNCPNAQNLNFAQSPTKTYPHHPSNLITNEGNNTLINRLDSLIHSYSANDTNDATKIDLCVISGFYNAKALQRLSCLKDKLNAICIILGKSEQTTQATQN